MSKSSDRPSVVITGVSSGIGWGATKVMIARGWRVFGSVRKAEDGARLAEEFGEAFVPLVFDVTDEAAVGAGAEQVRAALGGRTLGGLVNNAGIAVGGPLIHLPVDEFRKQLDVNLTGVLIATQAFAPLLGADASLEGKPGRIVNIGSVGGRTAFPLMGPYHVTKFGLEGFTHSLRRELTPFGIDVSLVGPGAVKSKIWDKAGETDVSAYEDTVYRDALAVYEKMMPEMNAKGLAPERIGEAIYRQLTDANPPVRKAVSPQPIQDWVIRHLPKRMVDGIVAGRMKLKRQPSR